MWVLIDNYDSFTYILHHYLLQTGNECTVYRNDAITLPELIQLAPSRIIISPGPETPLQAGISLEVIRHFHNRIPILGVCLGHQALGMFFGATLVRTPYPMHGKTSMVQHNNHQMFKNIAPDFEVMRYHSLAIEQIGETGFEITARSTGDNCIMAMSHKQYACTGLQFHPESIGTPQGQQMLHNWADMYR